MFINTTPCVGALPHRAVYVVYGEALLTVANSPRGEALLTVANSPRVRCRTPPLILGVWSWAVCDCLGPWTPSSAAVPRRCHHAAAASLLPPRRCRHAAAATRRRRHNAAATQCWRHNALPPQCCCHTTAATPLLPRLCCHAFAATLLPPDT